MLDLARRITEPTTHEGIIEEQCDCFCHAEDRSRLCTLPVPKCEDGCLPASDDEPVEWTWKCIGGTRYKLIDWRG